MKNSEIRKLSAVTSAQVVPLGTRWREDKEWPQRLRKRAKASDELFISKDGVVVASDLRVGFLAERIGWPSSKAMSRTSSSPRPSTCWWARLWPMSRRLSSHAAWDNLLR